MPYPTNGFSSTPSSIQVVVGDGVDSNLLVSSTLAVTVNGAGALKLTEDQTQDLFTAVGDTVKAYLLSVLPSSSSVQGEVVVYTGFKNITLT